MMSPVCRKFPGLKFVFSEGGIGWVNFILESLDFPVVVLRHETNRGIEHALETGDLGPEATTDR